MTFVPVRVGVALAAVLAFSVAARPASAQRTDRGGSSGEAAVARPSAPSAPAPPSTPPSTPAPASSGRGDRSGGERTGSGESTRSGGQVTTDTGARRRDREGGQVVGRAVPRESVPRRPGAGGTVVLVPGGYGFYPWGYGGLGLGGYYGAYYGAYYGGYGGGYGSGGYYDPWSSYGAGVGGYGYPGYSGGQNIDDDGAVRIKVKPRDASVYADGYFVGKVDDFDGLLQKLHLGSGPHRLEVRAQQYEPLTFDVRIEPDQTITYRGEMKKIQ